MTRTIASIDRVGPQLRARRLVFSDPGVEPRTTSASVVRALCLETGAEVVPAELDRQLAELEPAHARERALRLLGYRDRSELELRRALDGDGYRSTVVTAVIGRLVELAFLDDDRFARNWVAGRRAAGLGDARIVRELKQRGVAESTIAEALLEGDPPSELERAREALRGRVPSTIKERERLVRRLVSRGYTVSTARAAVGGPSTAPDDVNPSELP